MVGAHEYFSLLFFTLLYFSLLYFTLIVSEPIFCHQRYLCCDKYRSTVISEPEIHKIVTKTKKIKNFIKRLKNALQLTVLYDIIGVQNKSYHSVRDLEVHNEGITH